MSKPRRFDEDDIIEHVMRESWINDCAATSSARLAEATGVARGSLYNTLSNKCVLFERCLGEYQQQIAKFAGDLTNHLGTTRECPRDMSQAIINSDLAQMRRHGCLIGDTIVELADDDPNLARKIREMQNESVAWLARHIEHGQREGDVRLGLDTTALVEHIATALTGPRVMIVTHETESLHRVIDMALVALQTS